MEYYGLLMLVLATLISSVFVQGESLFRNEFFIISYIVMSAVLVIGSKREESMKVDFALGLLMLFSIGFIATQTLIEMFTNKFMETLVFRVAIIAALDFAAIGFIRSGLTIRRNTVKISDGNYELEHT